MTALVMDCTELYQNPVRTGIQRVVRKLLSHWPNDRSRPCVARFDPERGLVSLSERAIRILSDEEPGAAAMSHQSLVAALRAEGSGGEPLPSTPRIFIPEVFYDHARCRFYDGRAPAMLAYDFLPWLHPELSASPTMVGLMPYLQLISRVPDVAFISEYTRREYESRVVRRPASGPVLPLGSDGLTIEPQAWHPDRIGYVSLGSLDTRKNQHLIVEAFVRLWERGHAIPLTLIGRAFEGHKLDWLNEARSFPGFRWLDSATDSEIAEEMRRARATIYVSEIEGYGLPPVESLAGGVPAIVAASCPSVAMLKPAGMLRLAPVTPEAIADAVLSMEDDTAAAALWQEAGSLELGSWQDFARATADWIDSYSGVVPPSPRQPASDASPAVPEVDPAEGQLNPADMFAWWNGAALENPMTAILSNQQDWDPTTFFETGRAWLREQRAFAATANVSVTGKRALDFGCGIGRMTDALAEYFDAVVGVDISEEMVRLGWQSRRRDSVEFVQALEPPLPFGNRSFDCVYSTIVVQHIPSPYNLRYVREFFRISSDMVLFDAPSHRLPGVEPGPGIFLLAQKDVMSAAAEAGFELLALRNFPASESRQYQYLFRRPGAEAAATTR